jgi:histidinol-phosphate/aromatic aminotransferase/cobyric acid decarboxylase-like protein
VFGRLVVDGILVRDVSSYPGLAGHLRISVGTAEENAALLTSLSRPAKSG